MTKEELEKEAIAKYKTGSYPQLHPDYRAFVHGYLAGAEPREKRIEEFIQEALPIDYKTLSTEKMLQELKDRKVISSWYYNGTYHIGNELPRS